MTFLKHDPTTFADAAATGFASVHAGQVTAVPGGILRATRGTDDEVAVIIGGGSGHYPAFAGLVGPGLAHGAVLGNIFASPGAHQVETVARLADQGRGILLSYGNYAGDTLQFDLAAARLKETGLAVRTVRVTDDILSAPPEEISRRRGIAGDLVVFKVAGASAARGDDLDRVHQLAAHANARTRTLGVAFGGCTLPGSGAPLFSMPEGRMAVGLGIHGEPGFEDVDVPTPAGLADLLVSRLLREVPDEGRSDGLRAVVIVNGLGAFKADEMFVLYQEVRTLLESAGVVIADVKVGEFCTSFEMAGVSLTLFWPYAELEELWRAPAYSPAYSTGIVDAAGSIPIGTERLPRHPSLDAIPSRAGTASRAFAVGLVDVLQTISTTVDSHMDLLGRLDSVAGDGDHGIGMHNGAAAAVASARRSAGDTVGGGTLLRRAAEAWSSGAGGTSGALWCLILTELGQAFGDAEAPSGASLRAGVSAAAAAVMDHGGARVGDKTLVDALAPFADQLNADPTAFVPDAWHAAVLAAEQGAASTAGMIPGLGRARAHGEKGRHTPDPGATSFALIVAALEPHVRRFFNDHHDNDKD